jgi:intein/homing endonuclease
MVDSSIVPANGSSASKVSFLFRLSEDFVDSYKSKKPPFGYADAVNNSVGEITFLRTYSRLKEDGTKETWVDVCERVVNGMYSLQKEHCKRNRLPWNDLKAQASAKEAFDRLFNLKWTPPGRGLWVMGTPIVMVQKNSAALQNCAFVSTAEMNKNNPAKPFGFLMEASMLGVGVGFDDKGADKDFAIYEPNKESVNTVVIEDSREGWVESVLSLINSYLRPDVSELEFDYSLIRPSGTPIKTFGGTAAGADPLIKLHNHIRRIFNGRAGSKLTRVDIADIGNSIGVCVVSGNVRRSAELLIGRIDDEQFLNLKNAEVFPERNSYDPDAPGWGWMSNNSVEVSVGTDLSNIVDGIARNGEPGVIWMDISRKYGRLADGPNNKDWRIAGYNPCLVPDTWVMTDDGPKQIRDLVGKPFSALVNGKKFETLSNGFWMTSASADVYDVITDSGWTVRVTGNHQIMTNRGWVAAEDLVDGDEVHLHEHENADWTGAGTYEEGYLLGSLWGDGTVKENVAILSVWNGDSSLMPIIEGYAKNVLTLRSDWNGFTKVSDRQEWRLRSADLATLARSWGMVRGNKKIGDIIERGSSTFYKGFLQAAFDADGHVEGNKQKGVSIRLSQSDYEQLQKVQRMLGRLGILSKIRKMHDAQDREMPGGTYECKPSWRLIISGQNAKLFIERIGFGHTEKMAKWNGISEDINFYNKPAVTKFVELEYAGKSDVYDVTVADVHAFDANGLYVHNCAEQSLESYECCTLVETYLNRHESLDDFKRTLKFAYLYAKTVTLLPTHWEETNAIMQRNRRIGTSISGVANFADRVGMPVLRDWMDQGYQTVQRYDNIYSEWLGIRESIKTTTVKPSGTVSILAGESPGVHWTPGGKFFMRAIRFSNEDPMLSLFRMANYRVEPASESPDTTSVVFFPIKSDAKRSEKDVTIFEKISLAAAAQRYWSDNSVSVTVSFDSETEKDHVGTVLHMYDGQLKTVSFLPQGNFTYPQMPYTQITEEEYNESSMNLFQIDLTGIYAGLASDAIGENYCSTDSCEIKFIKENTKG